MRQSLKDASFMTQRALIDGLLVHYARAISAPELVLNQLARHFRDDQTGENEGTPEPKVIDKSSRIRIPETSRVNALHLSPIMSEHNPNRGH